MVQIGAIIKLLAPKVRIFRGTGLKESLVDEFNFSVFGTPKPIRPYSYNYGIGNYASQNQWVPPPTPAPKVSADPLIRPSEELLKESL